MTGGEWIMDETTGGGLGQLWCLGVLKEIPLISPEIIIDHSHGV